jgi:hypothetical protein
LFCHGSAESITLIPVYLTILTFGIAHQ